VTELIGIDSDRHGDPNPAQTEAIRRHAAGRHVYDLGAGSGALSALLLHLGARHVVAVDQGYKHDRTVIPRLTLVRAFFHELDPAGCTEVAFVSWPPYLFAPREVTAGLVNLCAAAKTVIYLGSNFGHVCGNLDFWVHVGTREVLEHIPDERNTLIVYGRRGARIPGQRLLPEEKAALWRGAIPFPQYGITYESEGA